MEWNPEALDKLAEQVRSMGEVNRTQAERLEVLERAHADLTETNAANERTIREMALAASERADGSDAEVLRAFVVDPNAKHRDGTPVHRGIGTVGIGSYDRPVVASREQGHAVRMYGAYDALGNWHEGLLDSEPVSPWHARAQELAEETALVASVARGIGAHWTPTLSVRRLQSHLASGPGVIGKIFSENSGYGAEVIPAATLPTVERAVELARQTEALFEVVNVGPGGVKSVPFLNLGSGQMYIRSQPAGTETDPANFKTSDQSWATRSFDPVTLAMLVLLDIDAEEDAIIQYIPELRDTMVRTRVAAVEDAIWNGDTATSHQDAIASWTAGNRWIAGSDKDHRKSWIGLRARAFDVSCSTDVSASATAKDYIKQTGAMKAAHALNDVVLGASPLHFLASLLTDTDMWRVDGRGTMATNLQGTLGSIAGRPLVVSEFLSDELNASGVYDGVTTNYGTRLAFDRSRFQIVRRRGLQMALERVERQGAAFMTMTDRLTFRTKDGATDKNVHVGYKAPTS